MFTDNIVFEHQLSEILHIFGIAFGENSLPPLTKWDVIPICQKTRPQNFAQTKRKHIKIKYQKCMEIGGHIFRGFKG